MGDRGPKALAKREKQNRRAAATTGSTQKRVVASPPDADAYEKPFRFRFNRVDVESAWCLTSISRSDHKELIEFMAQVEAMKVKEVIPSLCKREDVAGDSPNGEAKRRAREKFPDDHERIHSLRLAGAKRIWGLQYDNEFSVIWWDPTHNVWPTKKVTGN